MGSEMCIRDRSVFGRLYKYELHRRKKVGTGEMLGLVVLKLMVGSLIGIGVLAWRLLAVAGILLKNGISGIIWIIKRLKEMVIKNERKATGKIVL